MEIPKFKGIDPHTVLNKGQPLRTQTIETMLQQNGFVHKSTTGSHITYAHPLLKNIITIVYGSTKLDSQKIAANACLEAREAKQNKKVEELGTLRTTFNTQIFHADSRVKTAAAVPDYIDCIALEEHPDMVVIRMKDRPQIGTIAPTEITPTNLDPYLKELNDKKNLFEEALFRAAKEFEFSYNKDTADNLILDHKTYDLSKVIPAYDEKQTEDSLESLNELIEAAEESDRLYKSSIRSLIQLWRHTNSDGKQNYRQKKNEDGSLTRHIELAHVITGEKRWFQFNTTKSGRISPESFTSLLSDMFIHFMFRQNGDPNFFKKTLKKYTGINLKKSEDGINFTGSHPFHPELSFKMGPIHTLPDLGREWKKYIKNKTDDSYLNFLEEEESFLNVLQSIESLMPVLMDLSEEKKKSMNMITALDDNEFELVQIDKRYDGEPRSLTFQHKITLDTVLCEAIMIPLRPSNMSESDAKELRKATKSANGNLHAMNTFPIPLFNPKDILVLEEKIQKSKSSGATQKESGLAQPAHSF